MTTTEQRGGSAQYPVQALGTTTQNKSSNRGPTASTFLKKDVWQTSISKMDLTPKNTGLIQSTQGCSHIKAALQDNFLLNSVSEKFKKNEKAEKLLPIKE